MEGLAFPWTVPGAWSVPFMIASILLAIGGVTRLEATRKLRFGVSIRPSRWNIQSRIFFGHLLAIPIIGVGIVLARFTPPQMTTGLALVAVLIYLWFGWVWPRKPVVEHQRNQKAVRRLLPSFCSSLIVSLSGYEPRPRTLERYVGRRDQRLRPMQQIVADALRLAQEERLLPFAALQKVAGGFGVQELTDVAMQLAQAEKKGSDPVPVLKSAVKTMEQILFDQFREMVERRKMWLLVVSALSLLAVIGQILFVAVVGSGALNRFL